MLVTLPGQQEQMPIPGWKTFHPSCRY